MSLIVNHNLSASQTHRNLTISNGNMSKSIEKLSSGYKINVGADDPSGLIISEQLRSQISGLNRAIRNSSEASNLIGIAEGALNEMNEILKKMKALAIHAANSGVTSPEQVAADQSEMDSGIQTLERIANTTRYSDQYLLNGSKQLVYDVETVVNDTSDHQLLNTEMTRVDQIFKRDGVKMAISFTGEKTEWQANTKTSAQRAYLEADPAYSLCEVKDGKLTAAQEFILTGTQGSRLFSYAAGTSLGIVASGINNVKDSTGVAASLIFSSDVRIDTTTKGTLLNGGVYETPDYAADTLAGTYGIPGLNGTDVDYSANPPTVAAAGRYVYAAGEAQIYGANLNNVPGAKIAEFSITPDAAQALRAGYNCDGDGKIYAKVVDKSSNSIEYYKDRDCTMLIGTGSDNFFASTNNSNIPSYPQHYLDGVFMTLDPLYAQDKDVYEIAVVGQDLNNQKDFTTEGLPGWCDINNSVMSGVDLGNNTSEEGSLFFKYTPLTYHPTNTPKEVQSFKVEAFTHSSMEPQYLVASSNEVAADIREATAAPATGSYDSRGGQTVRVESLVMSNGLESHLNITLNLPMPDNTGAATLDNGRLPTGVQTGSIDFTNVGLRVYAQDYGSQETIRVQNKTGNLLYYYREADTLERVMVKPDTTSQIAGQDALIGINGAPVITTGLVSNVATADFGGSLNFNSGALGQATLAQTGHQNGSLYSAATNIQGLEENEEKITKNLRYIEERSLLINDPSDPAGTALSIMDSNNTPIGLYLDFSNLDPTIQAALATNAAPIAGAVTVGYTPAAAPDVSKVTIQLAGGMFTDGAPRPATPYEIPIDMAGLTNGYHLTEPALKGLYIKASGTISQTASDANTPGLATSANLDLTVSDGNKLAEVNTWATNPRSNTTETIGNFKGGMQFQLGGTEGDQDRTVYSVQSMVMANVGRMEWDGKEYCLQDVLGGGEASLSRDPIMSMRIVSQAIDDVTTLRARLGAFQKNMLETNINSLMVAVENITKTEAAIRDTDMAAESTEFTKNQVMVNAGTSMLAQANQVTQNVLQLLGR